MCGHKDTTIFVITKLLYICIENIKIIIVCEHKTYINKGYRMNKLPERIRIKDIARLADVSVGTVDRVIHGRSGVSEASKKRVEEILKQLDYQPNMYASALASNKKYTFICLLPEHLEGEYWTAVETGIHEAIATYSDFNTSVKINYYDPYDYHSFVNASEAILALQPDGVMVAPTAPQYTKGFTDQLQALDIPYIYIDSNIKEVPPSPSLVRTHVKADISLLE